MGRPVRRWRGSKSHNRSTPVIRHLHHSSTSFLPKAQWSDGDMTSWLYRVTDAAVLLWPSTRERIGANPCDGLRFGEPTLRVQWRFISAPPRSLDVSSSLQISTCSWALAPRSHVQIHPRTGEISEQAAAALAAHLNYTHQSVEGCGGGHDVLQCSTSPSSHSPIPWRLAQRIPCSGGAPVASGFPGNPTQEYGKCCTEDTPKRVRHSPVNTDSIICPDPGESRFG